ncbi:MAG: ATP-binding protein [Chlamydiae bacterium]|nr:ATP-binding protein [Chlamydiota bacterium]
MEHKEEDGVIFPAQIADLSHMLAWVSEKVRPLPMASTDKKKIELAVEEALVNVIRYAYKSPKGEVSITYRITDNEEVEFVIEDQGIHFNPFENIPTIDREATLEQREIGGLGILFMVGMMDDVDYDRKDGRNILRLRKKI